MLQESVTLLCQWGRSRERFGLWQWAFTVRTMKPPPPALCHEKPLSVEVLVRWKLRKWRDWKPGGFPRGNLWVRQRLRCSALKFPGNSWKTNQYFPPGIGWGLGLFPNANVQCLHCLLHVSLSESGTETTAEQGKQQQEEITTFSLIKRNVPNNSSVLFTCFVLLLSLYKKYFLHIVTVTESKGKRSHSLVEKSSIEDSGTKRKSMNYFIWLLPTHLHFQIQTHIMEILISHSFWRNCF